MHRLIVILPSILLGLAAGYAFRPQPKPKVIVRIKESAVPIEEIQKKNRELLKSRLDSALQKSWPGLLEVENGLAVTILHNRSALGNESGGFGKITDGRYAVRRWFVYKGTLWALVEHPDGWWFPLVWRGKIPAEVSAIVVKAKTVTLE